MTRDMRIALFFDGGPIEKSGSPTELLRAKELSELFKTPLEVVEKNDYRQVVPGT